MNERKASKFYYIEFDPMKLKWKFTSINYRILRCLTIEGIKKLFNYHLFSIQKEGINALRRSIWEYGLI